MTRLASRTKVKKDEYVKTKTQITKCQAIEWTDINVGLVKDLCDQRYIQHVNMTQHTLRYVCQDWLQSERELIRERGLWGPIKVCETFTMNGVQFDQQFNTFFLICSVIHWINGHSIQQKDRIGCERRQCVMIYSTRNTSIVRNWRILKM